MRRVVTILFIFVITITALACHKETEQDRVKKVITDIQKAAEEKDVKKIMNNISKTYSDPQGLNNETIKKMLQGYFFIHPKISAYITNLDISIENTSARAMFHTVLTSGNKTGPPSDLVPQSLGMYDFNVSLKKELDGWKITSATWAQAEMMNTGEANGP
jgi:ketosteroid isomerase-like protein